MKRPRPSSKNLPASSATSKILGLGAAALAAAPAANAATFTVSTLGDNGPGSLRQAIIDANSTAGADVVTFQAGLTGTITLTTGQLEIYDSVDIQGPGESVISVSGNNASRVFYLYNSSATIDVRIAGLTVTGGNDNIGGGIVDFDENLTLENVTITENSASGDGGGLWADGFNMTLTIRETTITGNTSGDDGGGIYVEDTGDTLLIEDSVISGNEAVTSGGGIYFYDPDNPVIIRNTTISGNTAGFMGGAVYLYSFDSGDLTIEGSTISGNTAAAGGGLALYSPDHGLTIENSTISGNEAAFGPGGGIYIYAMYYTNSLNFVTIANNTSSYGGGIALYSGELTISNSIIADNTVDDVATTPNSALDVSYTLIETPGTATINNGGGNLTGDPQLGPLANNGGPTQTQRPGPASTVINAADPAFVPPPATDQRGQARVIGGRADMGALEINGGTIQFNPAVYNVNETGGSVNLTVTRDVGPDPATVAYTTNPGTATAGPGNDYTTTAGTLTFAAGDLSETITVPILDDTTLEAPETFTATLSTPSAGATLGANTNATVTINDSPAGTAQFSVAAVTATEESGSVVLTVTRTGGTEGPLTVNYSTAPGTATPPGDYTTAAGTVTFPAGDATPQTITITLIDDFVVEPDETFTVTLTGAAAGSPSTAVVTIDDGDVAPAVPVPAVGLFGKLLLGIMTTAAAMWTLMRRGASMFLVGALLLSVIAATPMSAAQRTSGNAAKKHDADKAKETKADKVRGTLQSVTTSENGLTTFNFTNGKSVSIRVKDANVTDIRGTSPKPATIGEVTVGRTVVVKTKKSGKVKIKIVD
ncbi:MAG TPA: Calx-beta domain-containing protein [Thermoanaerobaculia bacterium]